MALIFRLLKHFQETVLCAFCCILHILEHYDLFYDTLTQLFESSVQYCCGIAAVMSLVILVAAYFFTDRSDVDAPEFVDE